MEHLFWGSGTFSHKDSHSWATDADVLLVVTGVGRFWEEREGISPPSGSGQKKKNRAGLGPEDYSCVPGIMCKKRTKPSRAVQVGVFKVVFQGARDEALAICFSCIALRRCWRIPI